MTASTGGNRVRGADWPVTFTTFGVFATFQLLLSALPVQAATEDHRASTAGYVTATLMGAAIVGQLGASRLLAHVDAGRVTAGGAVLAACSCLLGLTVGIDAGWVFLEQCARGIGFGIVSVASAARLVADAPPERRREGVAKLALITGAPGVAMAPLGLLLLQHSSIQVVFTVGTVLSLMGVPFVLAAPARVMTHPEVPMRLHQLPASVWIYALGFMGISAAWMTFVSYMPLSYTGGGSFAAICLLVAAGVRAAARFLSAYAEAVGIIRTLAASTVVALVGSVAVLTLFRPTLVTGAVLLGLGLGLFHSSVYLGMLGAVTSAGLRAVGVVWNVCIDAGGLAGTFIAGMVTQRGSPTTGLGLVPGFLIVTGFAVTWLARGLRGSGVERGRQW